MSTTIDQKVVEMRFDNKNFESNVRGTLSTLDKLKQKLNLTGASKGLENINASAKKVNLSSMSNAIETVHSKFSALEVMGVTALANITNSAVNAGKRIASALTIEPIKTGLSEYETQINSVQTILANTQKEGTDIKKVNAALDELNEYADKTIYNFTEMTRNIGTFTAAGVKLDTSVSAIKGISNLAAVSGSTSQQASTAMYQLSQALASGTVKLMDWNSVVNAGMGGQVFQDALKETARVHGVAIDEMIKNEGSFRDTLSKEWLTSEILTETLEKFTYASEEMTEAEKERITTMLKSKGYTDEQIEGIFKLGNTATQAATKVKTFTQLWDVLKEAAQSGWAKTWRLLIGDFEEAKSLFTPLSEFLTGFINRMSEARNKLLESALGKSFTGLLDKVKTSADGVKKIVDTVKDYATVVDEIIGGKWGNGQSRWDKLTEAGYDWAHAQNLVNEKLGDSTRHATNFKEAQNGIKDSQEKTTEATTDYIVGLMKLTEAELKAKGYTDEQIQAFKDLAEAADKTGIPIKDFIENIDEIDGRYLLINGFKNLGLSLVSVFKSIGKAWKNAFPPMSSDTLFNIIAGFHKFSTIIRNNVEKNADSLTRTLKGLFAIIDLIAMVAGGAFRIAFTILKTVLGAFDMNLLDFTALIGDAIVKVRDWIENNNILVKGVKKIAEFIKKAVTAVKDWISNNETIINGVKKLKSKLDGIRDSLKEWIKGLKETDNIPKYILEGLINGIKNGVGLAVDAIIELGKGILEGIKSVLGIHSPSTEFFEIGKNIIQGLVNGIKSGFSTVWKVIKGLGSKCVEIFKKIDFSKILAAGIGIGLIVVIKNMVDAIKGLSSIAERITAPLEGIGDLLGGIGNYFEDKGKAKKIEAYGKAILNIALAIGILAGSIYLLSKIKPGTLWATIGAIAVLAGIIAGLAFLISKMNSLSGSVKSSTNILAVTGALLLMTISLKQLASINPEQMKTAITGLIAIIGSLILLLAVIGKCINHETTKNINNVGKMVSKIAWSLLILIGVIKLASMLEKDEIIKGIGVITAFGLFIAGLIAVSKLAGESADKAGKMIKKISWSLLIMVGVIKLASMLSDDEIGKGLAVITGIGLIFTALIAVSKLSGANAAKAGSMMMKMSIAMIVAVGAIKLISSLNDNEVGRGLAIITGIGLIFSALVAVSKFAGEHAIKAGSMLLLISGALLILTGVLFLLSNMDIASVYKSLGIVAVLEVLFGGLMYVSKFAKDSTQSLIVITVAITLLVAAVIGLSFIDPNKLLASAGSISAVLVALGLLVASTKFANGGGTLIKTLLPLLGAIAIMALIIKYLCTDIKPESAMSSAISLSILLMTLSLSLAILGLIGPLAQNALMGVGILALMAVPLLAFVGVLALMQNIKDATTNTLSLIKLATALTLLLIPLSIVGLAAVASGGTILLGILALALMAVPLLAFVGVLALMQNINNATKNAKLLTNLMKVMADVLFQVSIIAPLAMLGVNAMTSLTLLMTALGVLAVGIGALMNKFPAIQDFLDKGLPVLVQLAGGIGDMVGAFVGGIFAGIADRLPHIGTKLSEFMKNAEYFISGAKKVDKQVLTGVSILAGAVLALTATDLIEGMASFISGGSSFAHLGTDLSRFMTNAMPFITGAKMIDPSVVEGIKTIAEIILTLTAADVLQGIASWVTGENSIGNFSNELYSLGIGLKGFSDAVVGINVDNIKAAAEAGKALAEMTETIPTEGGVKGWFMGETCIAKFGSELVTLGIGLKGFSDAVTGINTDNIKIAAEAGKTLAEMTATIPNEGGVIGWFAGENSIAKFSSELTLLGAGLKGFSDSVVDINTGNIKAAAEAGKILADMTATIPNEGGVIGWFTGENSIAKFGSELGSLGVGLKSFSDNVTGINIDNVKAGAEAAKTLAQITTSVPPNFGEILRGALQGLAGDDNNFSENFKELGRGIKRFSNAIDGVKPENLNAGANAANAIAHIATVLQETDGTIITGFITQNTFTNLGNEIKNFFSIISGITDDNIARLKTAMEAIKTVQAIEAIANINSGNINSLSDSITKIVDAVKNMASVTEASADNFNNALKVLGENGAKNLLKGFENIEADMKKVAETAVNGFTSGMGEKQSSITTACESLINNCLTSISNQVNKFETAGRYVVQGFANGISKNTFLATAKAKAMANAAEQAAKDALDINSPSKVFRKIGSGIPEGFAQGITMFGSSIKRSVNDMSDTTIASTKNVMSHILDAINMDMDTQPSIRPVLDLSDVESGVGYLSTMFNNGPSIGVMSNLRAISNGMDARLQNGTNDDIISAINKLGKDLGNVGGDTYNVNGITYDDGSNITEAVKSLIRAAKVERRI